MASGTIKSIVENGLTLTFTVTVSGADYSAVVSKAVFDALVTNVEKQNYVIAIISGNRRSNRLYEIVYPTLIGATVTIVD